MLGWGSAAGGGIKQSAVLYKIICVSLTETKHLTMRKNMTPKLQIINIDLNLLYNAVDCSKPP